MAKRGFFAELHHQNQVAARKREQAQKASARQQAAAEREWEAAQRRAERAQAQAERATAADQKAAAAEAKRLRDAAGEAEVATLNAQLAGTYDELDSLLTGTLEVDDYVDLGTLRVVAEHPPFPRPDLEQPLPSPTPIHAPPEPQWTEPAPPKGLGGVLGGKKRHEDARNQAGAAYWAAHQAWQAHVAQMPTLQLQQAQAHQAAEAERQEQLATARIAYEAECAKRQAVVDESNGELDELLAGLEIGAERAVLEYIAIVLGNSVYPDSLPVAADGFSFDAELRELTLDINVPGPAEVPAAKAFKYSKSSGEITSTDLTQKAQKDRYSSIVHQVALRSIHEVFEADRRGVIATISLTVGTQAVDPATGHLKRIPLVAVATDRTRFEPIDLSSVVPQATLEHLGSLVSKNPHGLVGIVISKGVRK